MNVDTSKPYRHFFDVLLDERSTPVYETLVWFNIILLLLIVLIYMLINFTYGPHPTLEGNEQQSTDTRTHDHAP